jgi:hypothetical protein
VTWEGSRERGSGGGEKRDEEGQKNEVACGGWRSDLLERETL